MNTPPRSGSGPALFRRWYERQLYASFAWLTLCLVCGAVFAIILEVVGLRTPGMTPLITLLVLYLLGLLAFIAWRQFRHGWLRAQACANRAVCASCGVSGLFEVHPAMRGLPVTCRCGYRWFLLENESGQSD